MPILDIGPVKLASDFKKDLTNSQFFYQVVEHHWKLIPSNVTKKELVDLTAK